MQRHIGKCRAPEAQEAARKASPGDARNPLKRVIRVPMLRAPGCLNRELRKYFRIARHVFLPKHGIDREREVHAQKPASSVARRPDATGRVDGAIRLACLWTSAFRP